MECLDVCLKLLGVDVQRCPLQAANNDWIDPRISGPCCKPWAGSDEIARAPCTTRPENSLHSRVRVHRSYSGHQRPNCRIRRAGDGAERRLLSPGGCLTTMPLWMPVIGTVGDLGHTVRGLCRAWAAPSHWPCRAAVGPLRASRTPWRRCPEAAHPRSGPSGKSALRPFAHDGFIVTVG